MKRSTLFGLVILLGMSLLLAGCSLRNLVNTVQTLYLPTAVSNQPQIQPTGISSQEPAQPTPTDPNADINQGATDTGLTLDALQSTLQAVDVSTPSSATDPSLDNTAQDLNNLLQTIEAEPTP